MNENTMVRLDRKYIHLIRAVLYKKRYCDDVIFIDKYWFE